MAAPKLALVYKNFAAAMNNGISHIGLGVAALNTAKVLRSQGFDVEVWPITAPVDLKNRLLLNRANAQKGIEQPLTHAVISAPWISTADLTALLRRFPQVTLTVNCHSNVGFLQADANGTRLFREAIATEAGELNFHVAGNSRKFSQWVREAIGAPCCYLPNLYYTDYTTQAPRPLWDGGKLLIGAFGAIRPLKNLMSMAGAAVEIGRQLKADTEFWINGGRAEGGGQTVLNAIRALVEGLPNFALKELVWAPWPEFRRQISTMHLMMQVSYTESFNMVTADGISQGVPSVVSEALEWAPPSWQAPVDDVLEIATRGRQLIRDPQASVIGLRALQVHNERGTRAWTQFLSGTYPAQSLIA